MLGGRLRCEMPRRFGGFFRNDADHRDFTAIGTAAGMAHHHVILFLLLQGLQAQES